MIARMFTGLIAGLLSVLLVHQVISLLLLNAGLLPPATQVYNMAPLADVPAAVVDAFRRIGLAGVPTLFGVMAWGGLWGFMFGLLYPSIPGGLSIIKGLLFGVLVVILSAWVGFPLLRGQPLFAGYFTDYNAMRLVPGAAVEVGFGTGLGLLYGLLRRSG
jgi:hypothetical protein